MRRTFICIVACLVFLIPTAAQAYVGVGVIRFSEATGQYFELFPVYSDRPIAMALETYGNFAPGDTVIVTSSHSMEFIEAIEPATAPAKLPILKANAIAANRGFDFGCGSAYGTDGDCRGIVFSPWSDNDDDRSYMINQIDDPSWAPLQDEERYIQVIGHFHFTCPDGCLNVWGMQCITAEKHIHCDPPPQTWGQIKGLYR